MESFAHFRPYILTPHGQQSMLVAVGPGFHQIATSYSGGRPEVLLVLEEELLAVESISHGE
jgi:hypothetical protein